MLFELAFVNNFWNNKKLFNIKLGVSFDGMM